MMKNFIKKQTAALAAVCLIAFIFTGCANERKISKTALKLDTVVTITLYGSRDAGPIDSAFAEIDRLAALLDVNEEGSDLDRLAQNAGQWIDISSETAEVLALAREYYELSGLHLRPSPASA